MSENGYSTLEIRVRAVAAVLRGQAKGEVANAFGVNRGTLYRWVHRHQQDGDHGRRWTPFPGPLFNQVKLSFPPPNTGFR